MIALKKFNNNSFYLGFDIGSSSIKASLVYANDHEPITTMQYPNVEMDLISKEIGWAEQHPEIWWENLCHVTKLILSKTGIQASNIIGIGITYQMHGLVLVDEELNVLRPSIIWCDSRAVDIGNEAFDQLTPDKCLTHLLNSPGNFTASKLKWVKENEPDTYARIKYIMLPGDYINLKLTGEVNTTIAGLSEAMLWDFKQHTVADFLLDHYKISSDLIPPLTNVFSIQGNVSKSGAEDTGLVEGIPVCYRAGDQPTNAMSLGVLHPNEVAATAGTSGVIYGIVDELKYDKESRINGFTHVNYSEETPNVGLLLCINGAGIQYSWLKKQIAPAGISYEEIEKIMAELPVGSDGLRIAPFGNGAERVLSNKNTGAQINNLHFNRHTDGHIYRAAIEGIAFSFVYGFQLLKDLGIHPSVIKVGNDNLFQSNVFATTIANLLKCSIQVVKTTGSVGAAKACAYTLGKVKTLDEVFYNNKIIHTYEPVYANGVYDKAYDSWLNDVNKLIK